MFVEREEMVARQSLWPTENHHEKTGASPDKVQPYDLLGEQAQVQALVPFDEAAVRASRERKRHQDIGSRTNGKM